MDRPTDFSELVRIERGVDLLFLLGITFEEAWTGTDREFLVPTPRRCRQCGGAGTAGGETRPCERCSGRGYLVLVEGELLLRQDCDQCGGAGTIADRACPDCLGHGLVQAFENHRLQVPAGVSSGARFRFNGAGAESRRSEALRGNLFVELHVLPHACLGRDGNDVVLECALPNRLADEGGAFDLALRGAPMRVSIPPGTLDGTEVRLTGLGFPNLENGLPGDFRLRFRVQRASLLGRLFRR